MAQASVTLMPGLLLASSAVTSIAVIESSKITLLVENRFQVVRNNRRFELKTIG
jgi:hypothetical protein